MEKMEREPTLVEVASSLNLTHFLQIQEMAPLEIAVPIYGYVLPVVVMITVVTNSFIVLVLSQPQLRTPTNCILLAMAVTELLTGLVSFPWMLYYYTFGGHLYDAQYGMPSFWCRTSMYFAEVLPTVFHTSAIWLTVYLAIQRYWFVCSSSHRRSIVPSANTAPIFRCRVAVALICVAAMLVELPMIFGKYTVPISADQYTFCVIRISDWVLKLGPNYFYSVYYWFLVLFVHAGPCMLLVVFGGLLIQTVHGAVRRRRESLGYLLRERDRSNSTSSTSSSMTATTKMLVVVIIIFLLTEIPAAVIFILHVLANTFQILPMDSYHSMNAALIFRNVFILISYPFNFCIYCSMSTQFRFTVRRLFCRQVSTFEATNTDFPRRSTPTNAEAYVKANSQIGHKRSSPLPFSSSRTGLAEPRRFSLNENPFLKSASAVDLQIRTKSKTQDVEGTPGQDIDQVNRNLGGDCFCLNEDYKPTSSLRSSLSASNGHCRPESAESKKVAFCSDQPL